MKNKKILIFSLVFLFCIIGFSNISMAKDLDLIHDYTITIDPRSDGSLDMQYHFKWEVLDSTSEGPLSWVKIGIPNSYVNGISTSSSNIKSIRYYEDNGDYIRIDFKKNYYAGDIITFDFKFHQSYMYELTSSSCNYSFTPGWFNDIKVKNLTILWNAENVENSNSKSTNTDNYLVWKTSLSRGKKYNVKVSYPTGVFNTTTEKQASYAVNTHKTSNNSLSRLIPILITLIIIFYVLAAFLGGGYSSRRGYGYDYGYRRNHYRTYRSRSSCACVSSCACACACAGGGRAGCSKKDFFGTTLKTKQLNKILNK